MSSPHSSKASVHPPSPASAPTGSAGMGCLARTVWMFLGNMALLMGLGIIARSESGFLGVGDLLLVATVPLMILVRHWDVTKLNGTRADGEPATMQDWKAYSIRLVVVAALAWGMAHGIAMALRQ